MKRALSIAMLALACVTAALSQPPAGPKGQRLRQRVMRGAPKGPRITNPNSPAARLYRATPEQRERVLGRLPQVQQERIRKNLEWFDALPKEDKEIVIARTERFAALTPEKRRGFLLQLRALNRMAPPRRQAVATALLRLQRLSNEQRTALLESEDFRSRFSADEQQMLSQLSEVMLPAGIEK